MPEPERLTFEIDGPRITAQRFKKAFDGFLDVANEVANQVAGKGRAVDWIVRVEPGSVRVHIIPEPQHIEAGKICVAIHAVQKGLHDLETGIDKWPEFFTEKALEGAKAMGEALSKSEGELSKVQVGYNGNSQALSSRATATVDGLLQGKYSDYGTLEGSIRVLAARGSVRFSIDDDLTGRAINCFFPKEMWDEVRNAFDPFGERRVSVTGMILYRRDGQPVNISVEEFRKLRTRDELPSVDDMIGILK